MRAVIQRVNKSCLKINNLSYSEISKGLLILLGVEEGDSEEDAIWLCNKIASMRIFSDEEGKMNLDINQINGELMIVSQFTLFASTKKGNRPSFIRSAKPDNAVPLYEFFISTAEKLVKTPVKTGVFGADMQIELVNDGPVTIIIDSKNKE